MTPYDDRRTTLDPGLTVLALRGQRDGEGRYPFLERARRERRWWLLAAGFIAACLAAWRRSRAVSERPPERNEPPAV